MRVRVSFVLVLALVGAGCGSSSESEPAASVSAGDRSTQDQPATEPAVVPLSVEPRSLGTARTYVDRRDRLRVKLPAGWHRASDRATDKVSLIDDILLAVETFPIRPRPSAACSDTADEPRVDVGPTDALILVEDDVRARADLARKRPRFRLLKQVAPPGEPRRARTGVFPSWNCRTDLGPDHLARRNPERQTKRLVAQLERLGHSVTLQEAAA